MPVRAALGLLALGVLISCTTDAIISTNPGLLEVAALREASQFVRAHSYQWIIAAVASLSVAVVLGCSPKRFWDLRNPRLWLVGFMVLAIFDYARDYSNAYRNIEALVLVGSISSGIVLSEMFRAERGNRLEAVVVLGALIAAISLLPNPEYEVFKYRNAIRATGPFDDPNTYGIVVATGLLLSGGAFILVFHLDCIRGWKCVTIGLAMAFCIVRLSTALIQSYSRGAWLAAMIGASVVWMGHRYYLRSGVNSGRRSWMPVEYCLILALLAGSMLSCAFNNVDVNGDSRIVGRMMSVTNVNDRSWRNRMVAWSDAVVMMSDKPVLGFGWGATEEIHNRLYRSSVLTLPGAFGTNGVLKLGCMIGLPALLLFFGYLRFSFSLQMELKEMASHMCAVATVMRGAAVVILVGTWFENILFKPPILALLVFLLDASTVWEKEKDVNVLKDVVM